MSYDQIWVVCQVLTADTAESFSIAMGLAGQAGVGDAWAAPALQIVCLLQRHLDAQALATLLPALLRLQHCDQVSGVSSFILASGTRPPVPPSIHLCMHSCIHPSIHPSMH